MVLTWFFLEVEDVWNREKQPTPSWRLPRWMLWRSFLRWIIFPPHVVDVPQCTG
eukprot:jgi/Botrbrau1/22708/Bobra.0132s0047.1